MQLPAYFLSRPSVPLTPELASKFDALIEAATSRGDGAVIDYTLAAPKWQFLCYLCDTKPILMHGSGNPNIAEFEPRQSNDVAEFGNRKAVYAASDAIWSMYFAIVDRERYVQSLVNSCFRVVGPNEQLSEPYYFFSINGDALPHNPWRTGTIYVLPRATFEQQARAQHAGHTIDLAQWASLVPVRPLAKLTVEPEDFPFLTQIVAHDPDTVRQRAEANPNGFPWLEE